MTRRADEAEVERRRRLREAGLALLKLEPHVPPEHRARWRWVLRGFAAVEQALAPLPRARRRVA
jgi:hypothetical protein